MENDVEEQSNRDEMKQVSNRKLPNTRSNGRCCFGFLSLRSGIFAVSAINFIHLLYTFKIGPSKFGVEVIGVLPIGTSYSLGCLSLCSNAIGFYGTYKKSAKLMKWYKRMISLEFVSSLVCAYNLYKNIDTIFIGGMIDPEALAEWARNTGETEEYSRKFFTTALICIGSIVTIPIIAVEGYFIHLVRRYQHLLEEEDKNNSSK